MKGIFMIEEINEQESKNILEKEKSTTTMVILIGILFVINILFFSYVAFNRTASSEMVSDKDKTTRKTELFEAGLETSPSMFSIKTLISYKDQLIESFDRINSIEFNDFKDYSIIKGITCFRGNNFRNSASYGTVDLLSQRLEKVWSIKTGRIDSWTGVGWNGQPAIVQWPSELVNNMNIIPDKKNKTDLKEVIYAALDGKIYFLDLEDGSYTRQPINTGFAHKGSISIDPRGIPLLYSGQGIYENGSIKGKIGYNIFSLIDQKLLYSIKGNDSFALRNWPAFDSTGIIDSKSDTLVVLGENGILYTAQLNTVYNNNSVSISPEIVKYRYSVPSHNVLGCEGSVAIYKNYAFLVDNSGIMQCVNLNTMSPIWVRDVSDDTDSTIALEEIKEELFLYTACEVDKQGKNGYSYVRKINAYNGNLVWEKNYKCVFNSETNGGALASPVIGKQNISNLVIFNIAMVEQSKRGLLVALDKETGNEVWEINLEHYSWSSPVDVYSKDGKAYIIQCDSAGNVFLINGADGEILDKINLDGSNIEASPAVFDDMIVVGTRGQKIFGIKIY